MSNKYIDNYEKNLIKKAVYEAVSDVALKLKEFGVDSEIIESTGLKL